jgi:hypothetical protein
MKMIEQTTTRYSLATRAGDPVAAELLTTERHRARSVALAHLFPGTPPVGCFGNRYATDQNGDRMPAGPVEKYDLVRSVT